MAQVKLLKINSSGFTEEHGSADDATFATVTGATQVAVTSGVTIDSNIAFNAVTDTIAGIENQNLLDKTADETLTGTYTVDTGSKLILTDAPTLATHAANKDYVDLLIQGNKRKDNVLVATTADITLSGEQTIDGVLTSTSRVLVKDQTDATENGIYVTAAGAWTRTLDANTGEEILGALTKALQGTVNGGAQFQNSNSTAPTLGSDNVTFVDLGSGVLHNNLNGLQGGNGSDEYYHLTAAEDTFVNATVTKITAGGDVVANNVDDTLTANYTVSGEIDVATGDFVLPNSDMAAPEEGSAYWDGTLDVLKIYDGAQYISFDPSGNTTTFDAGAGGITAGDVTYISANDTILKADSNVDVEARPIAGIALSTETVGNPVSVIDTGVAVGVLTGATAGTAYFLSETAGQLTTTAPTTSGASVVRIGYAKNATDLFMRIKFIGKRA